MSKTRFVAFATQKGGIGKSTITALVANYFHNVKGYNVAVIDCDEDVYKRQGHSIIREDMCLGCYYECGEEWNQC